MAVRRCSFCRTAGHNITRCDSEIINGFESKTLDFIRQEQENITNLHQYLLNKTKNTEERNLIKAFAIRKCGMRIKNNMDSCMLAIIQHFQNIQASHIVENNSENQVQLSELGTRESELRARELEIREHRARVRSENRARIERERMARRDRELMARDRQFMARIFEETIVILNEYRRRARYENMEVFDFINISGLTNERIQMNRKFNIKTKISKNQKNLEEKCDCNICYEEREKKMFVKLDCGHEFCKDCIKQSLQNENKEIPCCAFCRSDIKNFEFNLETIKNEFNDLLI
jgi:hypothetical protein